jgi:transposase
MKRLPVVRHLSAEGAEAQYRACQHPVEKVRWHAVGLLLRTDPARTPAQVADLVGLSVITTRDVLKRWNQSGPDGLTDGRKGNGSQSKLGGAQRAQLLAALKKRPPDGGLWSGPKVVRYVRTKWNIEIAELQPAEPLWPLVREAVANRSLGRIDRLRNIVRERVSYLAAHPDEVQPRVGFRWAAGLER